MNKIVEEGVKVVTKTLHCHRLIVCVFVHVHNLCMCVNMCQSMCTCSVSIILCRRVLCLIHVCACDTEA